MAAGQPAPQPLVDALREALTTVGCPPEVAAALAAEAVVLDRGGAVLVLHGQGIGVPDPQDPGDLTWTAAALAENVAAANAEAVDRTARGEAGWTVLWPLPDRLPRRG